ncbi:MAG TPA: HXXEE domain-containing protein [Gemmatimonadales bacterium]|jgi:hypothetical protein
MTVHSVDRLGRGLLLAPAVFLAHWLEESATFVTWFNARVTPGITADTFWSVNAGGFVMTGFVVLAYLVAPSAVSMVLAVGWLSFLMLTNAAFHLTGAIVEGGYVPGLWTAILLYLPYCAWVAWAVMRRHAAAPGWFAAAAVVGGFPMAVHGYRILFLGSRLF